jgi:SAM-dependent methyltransferase
MARWSRAARLLPAQARRVLDLGCAFGFGTRRAARGRLVVGIDVNEAYIRRAARAGGGARFLRAAGERLPFADAAFDAVLCLDVLEHVADERAILCEIARVLRPGGALIVSVPHRGMLARFDSINRCPDLWDMAEIAPGRDVREDGGEVHRHYSTDELRALLRGDFAIESVHRTGLGVAEIVNIPLLWASRRLLRAPRLYDLLPLGGLGYHLMVRATWGGAP